MKIIGLLLGVILLAGLPLQAQEPKAQGPPKAEIFGGFSFVSIGVGSELGPILGRQNFPGWQTSISGNITKGIGLVANFTGQYGTVLTIPVQVYEASFGPRFMNRREKFTGFSHALVGFAQGRGLGISESSPIFTVGGGVDINVSDYIAVRAVQIDWIQEFSEGETANHFRVAFGIVFKLGGK